MFKGINDKRRRLKRCGLLTLALLGLAGGFISAAGAVAEGKKPLIIVDPGHGGHDLGAEGSGGSLEKNITLRFANILKETLQPAYRVALTRTGDYRVNLEKRASMANHHAAELFISIHSGGFFRAGVDSWGVYYYPPKDRKSFDLPEIKEKRKDPDNSRLNWHHIQTKYIRASKHLAETLKSHLQGCPGIDRVKSAEAPLLLLEGINMPAVIVEAGYLTHPSCESRLNDTAYLSRAAECLRRGIDDFFREK
ncbi:MAG: N-acetylmuramoyl-L-alanine amidase [Desulfobacterales bacterium]|nr:N-acetylmuramoyl-L-alanine amidase [Desulfobacterales bacterium]